ncbi:hypothetical protein FJ941_16395 [Mesorhizobium sp. B2-3-13]|uniref:P-loop ATPase, Sll1717 family n=1 Tax=Mesorhizobium sp. B2-3-13 TaxID=2589951 RepID=UPI00112E503E|nr:hypothetical protein [Mesorhizobium sp. B2-3-13]TPL81208.1 hypothetical protein FJ941_16395 [Mesorhizobium sp. B2-3-13]
MKGLSVTFSVDNSGDKPRALNVDLLPELKTASPRKRPVSVHSPYTGPAFIVDKDQTIRILKEIKDWKLEAKLDDIKRYFFNIRQLDEIVSGDSCYIVGRKGTGKTALVQYISELARPHKFATKLSFKNFPFNELYKQENSQFTRPNQYITLWKLIIYSFVCRMMVADGSLDPLLRDRIRKAFPPVNSDSLNALIGRWVAGDVGISIFGTGFNFGNWFQKKNAYSLADKVENLEAFLEKNVGDSSYYVLFDELDEDYKNIFEVYKGSEYIDLLTSLFKAVQDVKSRFGHSTHGILPIIFLRDDIYDILQDADKNKWKDFEFDLEWNNSDIRQMLAYRLSKVIGQEETDFEKIWYSIMSRDPVEYANGRKNAPSFEYISRSTHGRPRDYIRYLQVCAEMQLDRGGGNIEADVIRDADKSYSNYLKDELLDEIHGLIPDINTIFSIISQIRKWILDVDEFRGAYRSHLKSGSVKTKDVNFVLQTLFYFSVIGNVARQGTHIFRHANPDAKLNFTEKIVVHRGLMKALQIL